MSKIGVKMDEDTIHKVSQKMSADASVKEGITDIKGDLKVTDSEFDNNLRLAKLGFQTYYDLCHRLITHWRGAYPEKATLVNLINILENGNGNFDFCAGKLRALLSHTELAELERLERAQEQEANGNDAANVPNPLEGQRQPQNPGQENGNIPNEGQRGQLLNNFIAMQQVADEVDMQDDEDEYDLC